MRARDAVARPASAAPGTQPATRVLLRLGLVAGPFYLVLGLTQALVRDGFDLARHPLSLLANGPGGWVQTMNFVLSGLMVIGAAVGIGRALRPASRATAWFVGAFGASMILAALFPADPVDGFPPGTPPGYPTAVSTPGLIHFMVGTLGFVALATAGFVAAAALSRRSRRATARISFFSGIAILAGFFSPFFLGGGTAGIWFSVVVGWTWLALLVRNLDRGLGGAG